MHFIVCSIQTVLTAEVIEREGEVEVCTDNPIGLESFTCVDKCPDNGNHSMPNKEERTCFGELKSTFLLLTWHTAHVLCVYFLVLSLSLSLSLSNSHS